MTTFFAPYTRFVGQPLPATLGAFATPKRLLARAWHKGDPTVGPWNTDVASYCPITTIVCDVPIRETGMYWERNRVNGANNEDSVAINCAVGDSILDNVIARIATDDARVATNPYATNPNLRIERVFAIIEYPGPPSYFDALQVSTSYADRCRSDWSGTLQPGDVLPGKVRAYVHIHPTSSGLGADSATKFTCPGQSQSKTAGPGLSPYDDSARAVVNATIAQHFASAGWAPVPFYAVDNEFVYRLKPTDSLYRSAELDNTFRWRGGRCSWVKPTNKQAPPNAAYFPIS